MRALLFVGVAAAAAIGHSVSTSSKPAARDVEVIGTDYAFTLPERVSAGRTTFHFRNNGKKRHELNISLLRPGVTIDQFIAAGKSGQPQQPMIEGSVGVLFAQPGRASSTTLTTDLVAGRDYAVICIFRDTAAAPRHYEMGMYKLIHVVGSKSKQAKATADSVIGFDYAYRYPRELSPGRHSLAFRNEGKHRHEIFVALLKPGVSLDSIVAVDKRDGNVFPLFEEMIGVLHSRAGEAAVGTLDVNFLPGREYLIDCGFQDDDKSPPHYKLGMYGSIKVSETPRS